jgi:hypothetical protein
MIYFQTQDDGGKELITYTHFFPFGNENGEWSLGKTEEELLETGYLIEGPIPAAAPPEGKDAQGPYYDPDTGDIWYEYVDHVPTPEEQEHSDREQEITELQLALAELYEMVTGGEGDD